MATIYIDNTPYEVDPEQNLLHACLSLGFNLPYFCWHPAMGSIGACRQCAVKQFKDEKDTRGKIIMACMTPSADGIRISIDDPEAIAFRKSVIEWLMLNHPHDCPVCDEGGECHLQDMTVMTGHVNRRTRFKKRTYRNQNLGPFINHEMNRCIQCYRCVRYYRDYAGGRDFNAFSIHNSVYFGRYQEGALENEFSGNLVEICPTGVFTDKTLGRHYTRKWDLQDAPSICVHCGLGCNTSPRARYGMLRRIVNRFHYDINGYFLCDRGRFGYEFVNSSKRIRQPQIRGQENAPPVSISKRRILEKIGSVIHQRSRIIGIGSPRASLEANYGLRMLVGAENFYKGMLRQESDLLAAISDMAYKRPDLMASIHDVEHSDAALVLGEDLVNTAPRLALALRQSSRRKPMEIADKLKIPRWHDYAVREAIQDQKGPLMIVTPDATRLDDAAEFIYRAAPQDIARISFAVAHQLNPKAPILPGETEEEKKISQAATTRLADAQQPVVIAGTSCGSMELIEAVFSIAAALAEKQPAIKARICFSAPECNSIGLSLLERKTLEDAIERAQAGLDAIVILENDLFRRAPSKKIETLLNRAPVIALDSLENATNAQADYILCTSTFAESEGTFINNEGRAQRFFKVLPPEEDVQESWRWLRDMLIATGRLQPGSWRSLDEVIQSLAKDLPDFRFIVNAAPSANFRISGQRIPRQLHRYSGRTAMNAAFSVHEPAPPVDRDSPLSFSMEGYQGPPPAGLASFFWVPGWNSYQAVNKYQDEIGGPLRRIPEVWGKRQQGAGEAPALPFRNSAPEPFRKREGQCLILPAFSIFGSEELSMEAPGIAAQSVKPHMRMNKFDARELGISDGDIIECSLGGLQHRLPAKLSDSLPCGVATITAGVQGLAGIELPVWSAVHRG
jgi:NADH-quinone oxidoreductase subunit G